MAGLAAGQSGFLWVYLLAPMAGAVLGPVLRDLRLTTGLSQPVAVDDVGATLAALATGSPVGSRVALGGPEALGIDAWARRLFAATGDKRTVVSDAQALYFGTQLHGGELTPGEGAHIGAIAFNTWFDRRRH